MITVGIPSYDHIKTECVLSLVSLITKTKLPLHFIFNQSLYIDYNRNQIVDAALAAGSTHLMFVDSDMQFPVDGIERLLAHDKDIVGAYYNTRRGHCPVRVMDAAGKLVAPDPLPTEPFTCHVLPTGFMLIRLSALEKLSRPYFAVITHAGGTIGEDVVFCKHATDAGLSLWCDPTIPMGHVGKHVY
jgi:hypothetical protein